MVRQYPYRSGQAKDVETALTSSGPEDLSKIRARNALKILLDVHGEFGRRTA